MTRDSGHFLFSTLLIKCSFISVVNGGFDKDEVLIFYSVRASEYYEVKVDNKDNYYILSEYFSNLYYNLHCK